MLNGKIQIQIQENIQTNPEGVRNALTEGMTALTNIETRINADSRNVSYQGINIEASHNAYTDYASGKGNMEAAAVTVAGDIRNAVGSGELTAGETVQLGRILTGITGDADMAGEYIRPVFAAMGAGGKSRVGMESVAPGDVIRPPDDGRIQPRESGYVVKAGNEGYIDSEGEMGDNVDSNERVKFYRVQGGVEPNRSKFRVIVNSDGDVKIPDKTKKISISVGSSEHALYFKAKRGEGAVITEFEAPMWLYNFLKENAISQRNYNDNPLNQSKTAPKIVDPTTPGESYELPPRG